MTTKPKNRKIKVKTSEVFETTDGVKHTTLAAAEKRQKEIDETRYYRISASPDCTEGRGLQKHAYAAAYGSKYSTDLIIQAAMYQRFGSPVDYVQGVSPTTAWSVTFIEKADFAAKPEEVELVIRGTMWHWVGAQDSYWLPKEGPTKFRGGRPIKEKKKESDG